MKFHRYFAVLFAILQISGVKSTDEEVRCDTFYDVFPYEEIYDVLWGFFGVPNYTTIVDYIESNKDSATYYRGALCHSCAANLTITDHAICDKSIWVIGICTDDSTDAADCAAVALYNLTECSNTSWCITECNSASWCSLWEEGDSFTGYTVNGSFSADCSGISSEYPSCTVTCENNVTTAEACLGDIAPTPTTTAPVETPTVAPTTTTTTGATTSSGSSHMAKVAIMVSVAGAAWLALFGT